MSTEVLKQLDLAQGPLGQDLLTEDIGNLFNGNALVRLVVNGATVGGEESASRCPLFVFHSGVRK
jgi:hypothetical protein